MTWSESAKRIRAIVLDVDGVLTDGTIGYGPDGAHLKFFHVRDGLAIRMALAAGLQVGFLSARDDGATSERARELGISFLYTDGTDKARAFARMLEEQSLAAADCLYVGDDLTDLPPLRLAGLGAVPRDAAPELRDAAGWVLERGGGHGAVREVIEGVLRAQGRWEAAVAAVSTPRPPGPRAVNS
jgi:3-deoxy-D-manno-octulosonate 8-phosphate phosphatase (KDO 8-P phosphatase)